MGLATIVSAAPFTNGSFESPGGAGLVLLGNGSAFVTGWTHGGSNEGYTASGDFGINAADGTHYISRGFTSATGGTLLQTFDTLIGTIHNVD